MLVQMRADLSYVCGSLPSKLLSFRNVIGTVIHFKLYGINKSCFVKSICLERDEHAVAAAAAATYNIMKEEKLYSFGAAAAWRNATVIQRHETIWGAISGGRMIIGG